MNARAMRVSGVLLFLCFLWFPERPLQAQDFDPALHGTVSLHLKAGDLSLADNAAVPAWGGLTAAGTAQPAFRAADARFNNLPAVQFDGTSDVMTRASANFSARTILAVVVCESTATSLAGLVSNGADGLNIRRNGTASAYRAPGQAQDANDFTGNGSPTGTLTVNGGPGATFTPGTAHLVIATAGSQKNYSSFWLGNASSSLGRYWRGGVAEVLIYSTPLTTEGLNAAGWYLQNKYNLPRTFTSPAAQVAEFRAVTATGVSSEQGVLSTAGAPVTLTWNTRQATTVSIDQGVLADSPTPSGNVTVSPAATTVYTLSASGATGAPAVKTLTIHIGETPAAPRLNEFMASNERGLQDTDGSYPDWIELYNPNAYGIDLHGFSLRDGGNQWDFPAGSGIPAGGFRLVYATGRNLTDPSGMLHAGFSLSSSGELLELVRTATGEPVSTFSPAYPLQYPDISYGWYGDPPAAGYFGAPTPGAVNTSTGVDGFLSLTDRVQSTAARGFYDTAVTTTLSASTPGATLIYTTNGSEPGLTNGTRVPPPDAATPPSVTLTIHPGTVPAGLPGTHLASTGGLTTLRAAAFLDRHAPTRTETLTFLFPEPLLGQTPAHATARGWPSSPVNGQLFNYGMDANVVNAFTAAEMRESLLSLPALSIVTDQQNLTGPTAGIYVNADQHGSAWERPVSLEVIHPPGWVSPDGNADGFQTDAGLRIRGGYSRNDQFFKHGFRLFFSRQYGGKLRYPLFGPQGAGEFGKLDLGTGSNYAWYRESDFNTGKYNTMVRDPFCRDTQGALGQPHTRSRYYHLFLNGHYWGIYYSEERAEAEYAASYFGGSDEEYDTVKSGNHIANFQTEATDGTLDAWQTLWSKSRSIATTGATLAKYYELSGRNADGTRNPALPVLLDIPNLIDEMLVIFYAGDGDAVLSGFLGHDRPNNWFSVYRRNGADGFRFFIRDAEHTLGTPSWVPDQTGPWGGTYVNDFTYSNPQRIHQDLMSSPEYKLHFADRVRRHFFDDGALTPAATLARFEARAAQLRLAMKMESARWGDAQSISNLPAGHAPRYLVSDWEAAITLVRNTILPTRTGTVLAQLKADGLYPALEAPSFKTADGQPHYGGQFPAGTSVRLSAPSGALYYTVDGSDPRLPGGGISPSALTGPSPLDVAVGATTTLQARAFNSSGNMWSALTSARYQTGAPATASNTVFSQVHYRPATATGQEEYLEVMNISSGPVDFTGCSFSAGIVFRFPDSFTLPAGGRAGIVRNSTAFSAAWPAVPVSWMAGTFADDTALSNSGETVTLLDAAGAVIKSFTYGTGGPWPVEANGTGAALVLIHPALNPDHTDPASWRRSTAGAMPAASDAITFTAWAAIHSLTDPDGSSDADQDGIPDLAEYALGTNPRAAAGFSSALSAPHILSLSVDAGPAAGYLTLSVTTAASHDSALTAVEASTSLGSWTAAPAHGSPVRNPDGTVTRLFRHPQPVAFPPGTVRQFLRLKATLLP